MQRLNIYINNRTYKTSNYVEDKKEGSHSLVSCIGNKGANKVLVAPKVKYFFLSSIKFLQYCYSYMTFLFPFSYRSSNFVIAKVDSLNLFTSFFCIGYVL